MKSAIETKKPIGQSKFKQLQKIFLYYEAELSGSIVLTAIAYHLMGYSIATKFVSVSSYKTPSNTYDKGPDDAYFVIFWTIMFTFLRATFMKYGYLPLANYFNIGERSKRQRVAEQMYIFAYYMVFGAAGLYIMYNSPYWFNTSQFWIGYPHRLLSQQVKCYYLMQLAFWFQQIYSLHTEARRKDHMAMLTHHIITILLVSSSYYANLTRVGNAVLCCMDLCDIFLAIAKILKYLGFTNICDVAFGLFAISWPITRHFFFSIITWSVAVEPARYFKLEWNPSEGKCFSVFTQKMFVGLLMMLNALMFYWFLLIVKVIMKLFTAGGGADDVRSDDEEEEEEDCGDGDEDNQEKKPL